MALQGTLDTFALPDVFRLLVNTKKTGRLRVSGDRGSGSVWFADGKLTSTELLVSGAVDDSTVNTLYHLLRFKRGSFIFESGALAPAATGLFDIEPPLHEAETMLVEWRAIETVIPSLDAWLTLKPEITGSGVKVDPERWRLIVAVAGGRTVGDLVAQLASDEIRVLRALKELVELGLVDVAEQAPVTVSVAPAPEVFATAPAPSPVFESFAELDDVTNGYDPDDATRDVPRPDEWHDEPPFSRVERDEPRVFGRPEREESRPFARVERDEPRVFGRSESWGEPVGTSTIGDVGLPSSTELNGLGHVGLSNERFDDDDIPPPPPPMPTPRVERGPEPDFDDPAELARQLANLSPRAAKAVAAAAKAQSIEEREAALAAIEAEDETVNRGLLLKFLGSVES